MKNPFLSLSFLLFSVFMLSAQIKEGTVLYEMKIEGLPPDQAALMGDMEMKITFKNGKSLTEINSMMFTQQIAADENGMTMLMEQMGNKIAIKKTKAEMEAEETKSKDQIANPKFEYLNDTKTIAGYSCKKAIITVTDKDQKENKVELWYSDEFENPNKEGKGTTQSVVKGIKGMPFEYSTTMGPMKIKVTAKEVATETVTDSKFALSTEGYKMMTTEELKAMSGGK